MINYFFPLNIKVTLIPFKPTFSFAKRFFPKGSLPNLVVKTLTPKFKLNNHRINNLLNIYNKKFPAVLPEILQENSTPLYKSLNNFFNICKTRPIFFKHLRTINSHGQIALTKETIDAELNNITIDADMKTFDLMRIDLGIANFIINYDRQISGLIPISKELREHLDNMFKNLFANSKIQNDAPVEHKEIYNYFLMSLGKTLNIFRGDIKDSAEFLSRVQYVFGSIDYPMPKLLAKYFSPIALLQHNLTLLTAYREYETSILEKLSDGTVDAKAIKPLCSMLNVIEQHVMYKNLGLELKKHPKVKAHIINSDNPTLLPDYNKEDALVSCHQPHPDFLLPIFDNDNTEIEPFVRYFDVKSNHENKFSHSRLAIKQNLFEGSFKETKNYMQSYATSLKNIIDISEITDNTHPDIKLLKKIKVILNNINPTNIKSQFQALNALLVETLFDKKYKGLFISLTSDAGIDPNFKEFHKEFFQSAIEKIQDNIIPHETLFPKDSKPDAENIITMVRKLIKFFPEEEQTSMWHNFERFGVPLIKQT